MEGLIDEAALSWADKTAAISSRIYRNRLDFEECRSLCLEALVRCSKKFDPSRGVKWRSFATTCMIRSCDNAANKKRPHYVPGFNRPEQVKPKKEIVEWQANLVRQAISMVSKKMSARAKRVWALHLDGENVTAISRATGESKTYVKTTLYRQRERVKQKTLLLMASP